MKMSLSKPSISLDKIQGMLSAHFCGDAMGMPYEFRYSEKIYATELIRAKYKKGRYEKAGLLSLGQCSDDTEMTISLLRSLIRNKGFNKNDVIMSYVKWANNTSMLGKNTRYLFKGYKTLDTYFKRVQDPNNQSNGALMRCSILALLWDNNLVLDDCNITNNNPVCLDCNQVYVNCLRLCLLGVDNETIIKTAFLIAQTNEVKTAIKQAETNTVRNFNEGKGWCLHGLYSSIFCLKNFCGFKDDKQIGSIMQAYDWVIKQGGDTDTNAAIAGAMMGAYLGLQNMLSELRFVPIINTVIQCTTSDSILPRSSEYLPNDFLTFTEELYNLFGK
jgi:ADP-ribosyl-[dinitrogen reductase] hydrolase